jgi:hypothetical protein
VPIACSYKREFGKQFCATDCPAAAPCGVFDYVRVETAADVPAAEDRVIDVAVLDMNHGWPNLGHDSLVHAVLDASCDLLEPLRGNGMRLRALSFDVRRRGLLPEGPGGRFALYLGTGGPGHIDPRLNDGVSPGSQGIREDPGWEGPFFRLLDAVAADEAAAFLAVCHTFGVMCRWAEAARPVLRPSGKCGKSSGLLENVLTPGAETHPWFSLLAAELPDGRRLRILDNRLYDLIPDELPLPAGLMPIGFETLGVGGPPGPALTMVEFSRDRGGVMPRVFGVNHHPEIVDRHRQLMILQQKLDRGEVTADWAEERLEVLTRTYADEDSDRRLHLTSDYTLLGPLRFFVHRQLRERAESLGLALDVHEDRVWEQAEAEAAGRGPVGTAAG